jgi:fimbrial isopeptide formation D2 family protein
VLAFTGVAIIAASPASAAPDGLPVDDPASLTITKYENSDEDYGAANGMPVSGITDEPVEDVEYKLFSVSVKTDGLGTELLDLTTITGWDYAAKIQAILDTAGATTYQAARDALGIGATPVDIDPTGLADTQQVSFTEHTTGGTYPFTTDSNGAVTISGLDIGVYLYYEVSVPSGQGLQLNPQPYLVTLPMTHPTALNSWVYDVYVYPKNNKLGITKTVKDNTDEETPGTPDVDGAVLPGDTIEWTITADIPAVSLPAKIFSYTISDIFPSGVEVLDPVVTSVYIDTATPLVLDLTQTGLPESGKYYLDSDADAQADPEVPATYFDLTVDPATITAHPGKKVVVKVQATVLDAETITNFAKLTVKFDNNGDNDMDDGEDQTTDVTSEDVDSKWGIPGIIKVGDSLTGPILPGTEFKVYTSESDALSDTDPVTWPSNNTGVLTVDGTGHLDFPEPGLRYSNWANGVLIEDGSDSDILASNEPGYQTYWLVEVTAHANYELLAQPVSFVLDETTDVNSTALGRIPATFDNDHYTNAANTDQFIVNVKARAGFPLPFTGGVGVTIVYMAGLAIIIAAIGVGVVKPRRRGFETRATRAPQPPVRA